MDVLNVIALARRMSGLSQEELARRAGTSRPTLSAYENGRKSPSLVTVDRVVAAAGFSIELGPRVTFHATRTSGGRVAEVPNRLWRLPLQRALRTIDVPAHLDWSTPGGPRQADLRDRNDRGRVYELMIREATGEEMMSYIDGALLLDLWPELTIPRDVRAAWGPAIEWSTSSELDTGGVAVLAGPPTVTVNGPLSMGGRDDD